jgi:pyruvate dehydrogenase E2 component (dihydrolipoamide acetyltransferase)
VKKEEAVAVEVVLPMLGIGVERGKIVEWLKKEGDPVEKGEIIFVVEVEKATTEVESPASGILAKILIPEGVEAPLLTVAAIITAAGEEIPTRYRAAQTEEAPVKAKPEAGPGAFSGEARREPVASAGKVAAMPAARHMARERGIDLATVKGTGPDGLIQVKDVEAAAASAPKEAGVIASTLARKLAEKQGVPPEKMEGTGIRGRIMRADVSAYMERVAAPDGPLGKTIPMSSVRKVIGRRMSESASTAPHIYFFTDVWMDPLLEFREKVASDFEKHFGLRPSINDFLIKAVALDILDIPMLNGQVKGEEIHILPEINIGLAVAMEEGLIVPAIANADRLGLVEIVRQRMDLVERARKGRLTHLEMERGTFTISSLAQFDVTHFTAILNPPQSGILSVGKTDEKLALVDGEVRVKRVATFGLSVDHRIIDGAVAARFLQNLKWKMERPAFTFLALWVWEEQK